MTRDAHHLRTDLSLRASGLILLGIATVAIYALVQHPAGSALAFLFAAIGFLGASAGVTLTLLGGHIHDPVTISARWQRAERQAAP
jgi:hypothetical protein